MHVHVHRRSAFQNGAIWIAQFAYVRIYWGSLTLASVLETINERVLSDVRMTFALSTAIIFQIMQYFFFALIIRQLTIKAPAHPVTPKTD
jgi:hypothetical protein